MLHAPFRWNPALGPIRIAGIKTVNAIVIGTGFLMVGKSNMRIDITGRGTGFDHAFAVDFACFDPLLAYLSHVHRKGCRIRQVTVS